MDENIRHSGIKNMKWGIRRFQNEDGSLTEAGRIRYARKKHFRKKIDKDWEKRDEKEEKEKEKQEKARGAIPKMNKKLSEYSDDELREMTNRLSIETQYQRAVKDSISTKVSQIEENSKYKSLTTPKPSYTKQLGKRFLEDAVMRVGGQMLDRVATNATNSVNRYVDSLINNSKNAPKKLSQLSDLELEKRVTRMRNIDMYYKYQDSIKNYEGGSSFMSKFKEVPLNNVKSFSDSKLDQEKARLTKENEYYKQLFDNEEWRHHRDPRAKKSDNNNNKKS